MTVISFENSFILITAALVAGIIAIPYLDDYKQWIDIETPGGLPGNRLGYIASWLITLTFQRNRRDPTSIYCDNSNGYLNPNEIPMRGVPSPEMAHWSIPHRQISHTAFDLKKDNTPTSNVARFFGGLVDKNRNYFIGASMVEKNIPAIFHKSSLPKNEVIHRHVKDGSFHITLHCQDAKIIVEKKWGELFPIPPYRNRSFEEVVLLYAPQSIEDYKMFETFADAAIKHFDTT